MRLLWTLLLSLVLPLAAHEGHDHGSDAPPPTALAAGAPRASAQSPDLEAVVVLEGAQLIVYLDRFASNEPLSNAAVEVESGSFKTIARMLAPGVYAAKAEALGHPGKHSLTLVVQAGALNDLLTATLDVTGPATPPRRTAAAVDWKRWGAIAAGVALLLVVAWALLRRSRRRRAVAGALAAIAAASWLATAPGPVAAHGDEDHSQDGKAAKSAAAPPTGAMVTDSTSAQRLIDGSVFMPKAVQYQIGLRHQVAVPGEHAATLEFSGRVIADPNAGGRVQGTQPGRVEVGPRGLPSVGQRVVKGQLLAVLRPSAGSIERSNQRATRAELESLRLIAQRRLQRLEQLDGAVPQKEVEAARIELESLQQRSEAVGAGLAATEALHAPTSGIVSAVNVVAGQVVDARETLIEIIDPSRLGVEALAHDPVVVQDLTDASAEVGGRSVPLQFVGAGRQLREQAMPLLFRVRGGDAVLAVGQPLKVIARTTRKAAGVAVPRSALVRLSNGDMGVWIHAGAERFVARRVGSQVLDGDTLLLKSGVEKGERIVTEGASLLAQVR